MSLFQKRRGTFLLPVGHSLQNMRAPSSGLLTLLNWKCQSLSHIRLFATPWTVAHQAFLSMGILQAGILEWLASPFSNGFSQPRDRTWVSRITGRFFTIWANRKATYLMLRFLFIKFLHQISQQSILAKLKHNKEVNL